MKTLIQMKANIVGRGSFGKFLKENYFKHDPKSNIVVLAIPASAFEEVCKKHQGKIFINVCSVQSETNKICEKYGKAYSGVHPLFGHRSDPKDRRVIITHCDVSVLTATLDTFSDCEVLSMSAKAHDKLMAKTHAVALEIAGKYAKHFRKLKVDEKLLPASVIKLREAIYLIDGMTKGTVDSIKSNPFK